MKAEMNTPSNSTATILGSENSFRMLVESLKDYAIVMLDPGGHIASWNAGAERFKGYRAEEIVGKYGNPGEPQTAELLDWLDSQTKRNLVITFGGGVNEVMREQVAASGLKVPRVPR